MGGASAVVPSTRQSHNHRESSTHSASERFPQQPDASSVGTVAAPSGAIPHPPARRSQISSSCTPDLQSKGILCSLMQSNYIFTNAKIF